MPPPPPPPPPSATYSEACPEWTAASRGAGGALRSIPVAEHGHWFRRLLGFLGPGYLVAIGYMDPGNWATDLAAGSAFGYSLLWVIMISNLMAILLQVLSARLGIVTGMDLAQACRRHYPRSWIAQWILCEIAICACDLAEVIGTAIALNLLFHVPLMWGVSFTILDVLLVLWLQHRGFRYLEAIVIALLFVIFACFAVNLALAHPAWKEVAAGLLPSQTVIADPRVLYLAIGIIGATVMPHNLYLHSSTVQTRRFSLTCAGRRDALRYACVDIVLALLFAFLVNAAILITAASVFHKTGHEDVVEIQHAYDLLSPLLGSGIASLLFGLALLASGQSSTLTATLAGQIVMEGFLKLKAPAWARRLLTRSIAIVPALLVTALYGESGTAKLLILSQVILSLQLPFAVVPLVRFTSDKAIMGSFVNPRWMIFLAWAATALIVSLNIAMLFNLFQGG